MPSDELVEIGKEIVELAAAWPDTGLDRVGQLAQDLGEALQPNGFAPPARCPAVE